MPYMKRLDLKALGVLVDRNDVLALAKGIDGKMVLYRIRWPSLKVEELCVFEGVRGFMLAKAGDMYLASIDERLLTSLDLLEWRVALRLRPGNTIWHACETPWGIVAQEYGEAPTGLWISSNGVEWRLLMSNSDVDPYSKHFHYVAYDVYRDVMYVTLGDGNLTRAIAVKGDRWRPIYRGPWQFVPIAVLRDRIVFGFDSGIARGGLGIYYPEEDGWDFVFLKWVDRRVRHSQMNELRLLRLGVWVAALGAPQAITTSRDLANWSLLHLEGLEKDFRHYMNVVEGQDFIASSTGSSLVIYELGDIEHALNLKPVMIRYRGYLDRVKGLLFTIKRIRI